MHPVLYRALTLTRSVYLEQLGLLPFLLRGLLDLHQEVALCSVVWLARWDGGDVGGITLQMTTMFQCAIDT